MIVSFPMYDRPETYDANNRLFENFKTHFPGFVPDTLARSEDPWLEWTAPNLLLSQSCSLPYRTKLHGHTAIVGTPHLKIDSAPGYYHSKIVVRASDTRTKPEEFADAELAINGRDSQSGWTAAQVFAMRHGFQFSSVNETGAHIYSAYSVANGTSDIAAIDALTWRMIQRWDTWASKLCVLARTEDTPATPYVTARPELIPDLFAALSESIQSLSPEDRDILGLESILLLPPEAYRSVEEPESPTD